MDMIAVVAVAITGLLGLVVGYFVGHSYGYQRLARNIRHSFMSGNIQQVEAEENSWPKAILVVDWTIDNYFTNDDFKDAIEVARLLMEAIHCKDKNQVTVVRRMGGNSFSSYYWVELVDNN